MAEPQVMRIEAGSEIPVVGSPLEARTVFADGIGGLTVDASTAKLFLYEKLNGPDGKLVCKISTNLTLSRDGLAQMADILNKVVAEIQADDQKTA